MLNRLTYFLGLGSFPTWLFCGIITSHADFFIDHSHRITKNPPRLSYGISVTDLDNDGSHEFIVTGFGYPNLALTSEMELYQGVKYINCSRMQIERQSVLLHATLMVMVLKKSTS